MPELLKEIFCDFHEDTPTRLSCVSCGKHICPKCMIGAAVGYKCPECANANKTHIEEILLKQYLIAGFTGLVIGAGAGYIWHYLSMFGIFINLMVAYAVGFCISKAISLSIGSKIGLNIQVFTGIITVISIVYNPIIAAGYMFQGIHPVLLLVSMSSGFIFSIMNILAVVIKHLSENRRSKP